MGANLRIVVTSVLAGLLTLQAASQSTQRPDTAMKDTFAKNRLYSKGGLGIVNRKLYIDVKSRVNELLLKPTEGKEERWKGRASDMPELIVVYEGKAWPSEGLPEGFRLSEAVVISFEVDKIRFFDFQVMSGGYYERIGQRREGCPDR
jgi:hypothetical protein